MARIKFNILNLIFVAMIYAFSIGGLLIVNEMQSAAASGVDAVAPAPVEAPRPIAPQRDISAQRMAPLAINDELPPFWSR
ncbi:MAG: hypothetical protein Kow0031_37740 [Anaerolineae bacterium]